MLFRSKFNYQQEDVKNQLAIHTLENKKLTAKVNEQDKLFKETKGNEARYQVLLADSRKRASEIKSRIYELLGVTVQITFGEAANIAKWASGPTNIRPAFLLAILTQESNLGKNVGTCNRIGDPKDKNWRAVMKPDRDQQAFLTITAELGKNPELTPVSCPRKDAKGNNLGWGGAMGPAQFIPSTWLRYKDKVTAITGKIANPWDIRDAFLAAALLLKDNGASSRDKQAEWKAAMRYFSGSTDQKNRFYGDNVQDLAAQYEEDLKTLGG